MERHDYSAMTPDTVRHRQAQGRRSRRGGLRSTQRSPGWKCPRRRPCGSFLVAVSTIALVACGSSGPSVWPTDFGANAIVHFDPRIEEFLVFELVSPDVAVRQQLGRPGEVWGAESGTDRLVVVRSR